MHLIIDAHQHFWQIGHHDCSWPTPDLNAIYRDFDVDDLVPLAHQYDVVGSVLVQSQTSDKDTDFLLALAQTTDFVKAVVGWLDLTDANAPQRISDLTRRPKFRGLRPMLQNLSDHNWISRADIAPAIEAMLQHEVCFDALVDIRHVAALHQFAQKYTALPIVIDHAAKPAIANANGDEFKQWCDVIAALGELPNVYCKISGLLTEAAAHQGADDLLPYVQHLYAHFGAQRLMWGSDWPVLSLAANPDYRAYGSWLALAKLLTDNAGAKTGTAEQQAIFAHNAARFYRFDLPAAPLQANKK